MPEASATTRSLEQQIKSLQEENRNLQERLQGGSATDLDLRVFRLNEELRADLARQAAEIDSLGDQNIDLAFQVEDLDGKLSKAVQEAADLKARLEEVQARAAGAEALQQRLEAAEAALQDKEQALAALEGEAAGLRGDRERLEGDLATARQEGQAALESARKDGEAALESARREAEAAAEAARKELEEARASGERLGAEAETLRQQLEAATAERDRLAPAAQRGEQAEAELQAARQEAERLGEEARRLSGELEAKGREAHGLAAELDTLRGAEAEQRQKAEQLQQDLESAQQELSRLRQEAERLPALQEKAEQQEKDLAAAREESSGLRQELSEARGRLEALEQESSGARDRAQALEQELAGAQGRARSLEEQLASFKQQFLQRAEAGRASVEEAPAALAGTPREVLTALMGEALGSQGRRLVDRTFEKCEVDLESRDAQALAGVVEALEEHGARLARSDDQKQKLAGALADFRRALAESGAAPAAPPPARQPESAAPPAAPPPPPAAEAPRREEEPPGPAAPEPAALPTPADEEAPALAEAHDQKVLGRVEEGRKLLRLEKYEEAYDLFTKLAEEHPDVLEVQQGLFYAYVGFFSWKEALDIGRRLAPRIAGTEDADRFRTTMDTVLKEYMGITRKMDEKKRLHLEMAELHLDDPRKALDQLRKARQIPERIPEEARIDFYLLRFLADSGEDRLPNLLASLEGVPDRLEVFEHMEAILADKRHAARVPAGRTVLSLVRRSRDEAAAEESAAGAAVAPVPSGPQSVEAAHHPEAGEILTFVLDQLLPRAQRVPTFPSPAFSKLAGQSERTDRSWGPAGEALMACGQYFPHLDVELLKQPEDGPALLAVSAEATPVLAFHPRLEAAPSSELRFLALRYLFQAHRRQTHVWRAAETLDDADRCRLLGLTRDLVQESGTDISDSLEREIDALVPSDPALEHRVKDLLKTLHEHSQRNEFRHLRDLFFASRPFAGPFDREADRFAGRVVGPVAASYAVAREALFGDEKTFERIQQEGFQVLYHAPEPDPYRALRSRLQRLWLVWL